MHEHRLRLPRGLAARQRRLGAARAGRRRPSADAAGRAFADGAAHQPRQSRAADHPLRPGRQRRRQARAVRVRQPASGDPGRGQARRRGRDDRAGRPRRAAAAARADDDRRGGRARAPVPDRADRRATGCCCASIAATSARGRRRGERPPARCAAISSGSRCPTCASVSTSAARSRTGAAASSGKSSSRGRRRVRIRTARAASGRARLARIRRSLSTEETSHDRHHRTPGRRGRRPAPARLQGNTEGLLHLPGPDFVDRVVAPSDRSPAVLRSLQQMFGHGRLAGTGYLSILPVDQGIEHTAGASFAPNPLYFDPENIVEAGDRGRLQRGGVDAGRARRRARASTRTRSRSWSSSTTTSS